MEKRVVLLIRLMRLLVIVIFHTLELVERDGCSKTELQHQVMIEAVENHMPQVIIIDEIGTELEVLQGRSPKKVFNLLGRHMGTENLKKPFISRFNWGYSIRYFK
jgi:hypothetical protein